MTTLTYFFFKASCIALFFSTNLSSSYYEKTTYYTVSFDVASLKQLQFSHTKREILAALVLLLRITSSSPLVLTYYLLKVTFEKTHSQLAFRWSSVVCFLLGQHTSPLVSLAPTWAKQKKNTEEDSLSLLLNFLLLLSSCVAPRGSFYLIHKARMYSILYIAPTTIIRLPTWRSNSE